MKRLFCLIVLSVMCFICSGCFQVRTDLTISEDGSVRNNIRPIRKHKDMLQFYW